MKRFLLTAKSKTFNGTAEVWYNDSGMLARLDLIAADMNWKQVKYLLQNTPPDIASLKPLLSSIGLEITEYPFEITVDDFLKEYPYKRNTHLVRELWPRLTRDVQERAYFAAMEYADYLRRNDWCKPQIPNTWLTKKQYLNNWKTL